MSKKITFGHKIVSGWLVVHTNLGVLHYVTNEVDYIKMYLEGNPECELWSTEIYQQISSICAFTKKYLNHEVGILSVERELKYRMVNFLSTSMPII